MTHLIKKIVTKDAFLTAILTAILTVTASVAKAFRDVEKLKTRMDIYVDNIKEVKEDIKEVKGDIKLLLRRK